MTALREVLKVHQLPWLLQTWPKRFIQPGFLPGGAGRPRPGGGQPLPAEPCAAPPVGRARQAGRGGAPEVCGAFRMTWGGHGEENVQF